MANAVALPASGKSSSPSTDESGPNAATKYHQVSIPTDDQIIVTINVKAGQLVRPKETLLTTKNKTDFDRDYLATKERRQLGIPDSQITNDKALKSKKAQAIKSPCHGKVEKVLLQQENLPQKAIKNAVIIVIRKGCTHPIIFNKLCTACGQVIEDPSPNANANNPTNKKSKSASSRKSSSRDKSSTSVRKEKALIPNMPDLRVQDTVALDISRQDKQRLHLQQKLVLLCDLDHTLIHTTEFNPSIKIDNQQIFKFSLPVESAATTTAKASSIGPSSSGSSSGSHGKGVETVKLKNKEVMYHATKLRPTLLKFLENISQKYELYIATLGVRSYAQKISRIIDPEQKYFSDSRMLSRDDLLDNDGEQAKNGFYKANNLKHMFPCGEEMVTIIDDRVDVWRSRQNVLHVPKYYYWSNGDINDPFRTKTANNNSNSQQSVSILKKPATTAKSGKKHRVNVKFGDGDDILRPVDPVGVPKIDNQDDPEVCPLPDNDTEDEDEPAHNPYSLDEDDYLERLQDILNDVHYKYYKSYKKQTGVLKTLKPKSKKLMKDKLPRAEGAINAIRWKVFREKIFYFDSKIKLFGPYQSNINYKNRFGDWKYDGWWGSKRSRADEYAAVELAQTVVKILGGFIWDPKEHKCSQIDYVVCPTKGTVEFPMRKLHETTEQAELYHQEKLERKKKDLYLTSIDPAFVSETWIWQCYWHMTKLSEYEFLAPEDLLQFMKHDKILKYFKKFDEDNYGSGGVTAIMPNREEIDLLEEHEDRERDVAIWRNAISKSNAKSKRKKRPSQDKDDKINGESSQSKRFKIVDTSSGEVSKPRSILKGSKNYQPKEITIAQMDEEIAELLDGEDSTSSSDEAETKANGSSDSAYVLRDQAEMEADEALYFNGEEGYPGELTDPEEEKENREQDLIVAPKSKASKHTSMNEDEARKFRSSDIFRNCEQPDLIPDNPDEMSTVFNLKSSKSKSKKSAGKPKKAKKIEPVSKSTPKSIPKPKPVESHESSNDDIFGDDLSSSSSNDAIDYADHPCSYEANDVNIDELFD